MTADQSRTTARVLFASVSARGQINPLLTIANELSRRGTVDEIWFASTNDRRHDIEASNAVSFASLGEPSRRNTLPDWDDRTYDRFTSGRKLRSYGTFLAQAFDPDFLTTQFDRTLSWIDELQPRVMVIDVNSYGAVDAARLRGIPYLLNVSYPVSGLFLTKLPWAYPTPFSGLPRTMSAGQLVQNALFRVGRIALSARPAMLKMIVPYRRDRRCAGVLDPAGLSPNFVADASEVIGCSVWGIEQRFAAAPGNLHMVGAVVPPVGHATGTDADDIRTWLDARESVVYVAFGTIVRLRRPQISAIVDAVARLHPRHQVLWKLPSSQQELLPAHLPQNLRVENWIPSQIDVLAHPNVRAFFTHGGGNSAHEGLRFGNPLLVMPLWLDCYDIAARVVETGAALPLGHSRQLDGAEIATKLERLLIEPGLRERATHWAGELAAAGGAGAVAALIEKHCTGAPDRSAAPRRDPGEAAT